ncbi:hypothetical protein, conserved [Trypanosoma brucei gambiense DAL972]|uniref:Uncharacterized protein n=2 Tax=Trypanosoma brucei TaxID=5691 RepID=D0A1C1_TRYB9|nr:hypothetical protein, conserved [Trypanosoma brucei gambiense DAL972]RHW69233.1 hypothetical protein DPX39_100017200 [Trypanosoma brucei equiperdum]CBH15063.1 hypothetical protein, conserved [Trypanosoma brucei gambiense DAL972]|eukprot:XP_011777329.1 hypothetical protein, conserved [Trypanosoma brucei gambiense DAL972]
MRMSLTTRRPFCPVLLNIGSSRAVTLSHFHAKVCPSITATVKQTIRELDDEASPNHQRRQESCFSSGELRLRPYGFSPERPQLQHESWSYAWHSYLNAVRLRGEVSAAGVAPLPPTATSANSTSHNDDEFFPMTGTLTLPVPVVVPTSNNEPSNETIMMEFFRVDAFIPVRVQMYHVMRRLIKMQAVWNNMVAIGIVVPTHEVEYFISAARAAHASDGERTPDALLSRKPSVLVYDPEGLRFQVPESKRLRK